MVNQHHYLASIPTASGALLVVVILGGICRTMAMIETREQLDELVAAACAGNLQNRGRVRPHEADVSTIMAHWIRRPFDREECLIGELDPQNLPRSLAVATEDLTAILETMS
jgi:hypothetical protein